MTKGKGDGGTALKKAFKGRDYGERGQTGLRKKFGFLEKRKDYVVRAKSFKNKRQRLREMRTAASLRNPDEFHTKMMNTETDEYGRHMKVVKTKKGPQQKRENAVNARYLQHKAAVDHGAAKQMRRDLGFMDMQPVNSHQIFIDEDEAEDFSAADYFETAPELLNNISNRPKLSLLKNVSVSAPDSASAMEAARKYNLLSERIKRKKKLDGLLNTISDRQKLLSKGKRVLQKPADGSDSTKKTYKWLYERKR